MNKGKIPKDYQHARIIKEKNRNPKIQLKSKDLSLKHWVAGKSYTESQTWWE